MIPISKGLAEAMAGLMGIVIAIAGRFVAKRAHAIGQAGKRAAEQRSRPAE